MFFSSPSFEWLFLFWNCEWCWVSLGWHSWLCWLRSHCPCSPNSINVLFSILIFLIETSQVKYLEILSWPESGNSVANRSGVRLLLKLTSESNSLFFFYCIFALSLNLISPSIECKLWNELFRVKRSSSLFYHIHSNLIPAIHDEVNNSSIGDKKATCLVKRGLACNSAWSVVYVFCHARLSFTSLGLWMCLNSLWFSQWLLVILCPCFLISHLLKFFLVLG